MTSRLDQLTDDFLREGGYLRNWSQRTLRTYRQGLAELQKRAPQLTKKALAAWVVSMRERGLTPGGCNMYIRTVNSFLTWAHEEGHTTERLRVKLLRAPQKVHTLLSVADLRAIVRYKPETKGRELRTWTLVMLLLDTGVRIEEGLGIRRDRTNLDSLTLVVFGKGAKERIVPISLELRKVLFRWLKASKGLDSEYLFPSRSGGKLEYRNVYRDIRNLCRSVGVKVPVHPHLFRHQFAASYIQRAGRFIGSAASWAMRTSQRRQSIYAAWVSSRSGRDTTG